MNRCILCGDNKIGLCTTLIEIADEKIKCFQCPTCLSVILKNEDIEAINNRYSDIVEKNEELQDELDNLERIINELNAKVPNEDSTKYVDSCSECSFESPR